MSIWAAKRPYMKHGFQNVGRSFWKARSKGDCGQGERGLPLVRRAMRQERFWAENARISRKLGRKSRKWGEFRENGRLKVQKRQASQLLSEQSNVVFRKASRFVAHKTPRKRFFGKTGRPFCRKMDFSQPPKATILQTN